MTNEQHPRGPDSGLIPVSGDAHTMSSESAYRDLEQSYRCSEQYAAMRQRYPQLRFWIARCDPSDLVGGLPPQTVPCESQSALHWDRSHGES